MSGASGSALPQDFGLRSSLLVRFVRLRFIKQYKDSPEVNIQDDLLQWVDSLKPTAAGATGSVAV
jgi:hypothetical protein